MCQQHRFSAPGWSTKRECRSAKLRHGYFILSFGCGMVRLWFKSPSKTLEWLMNIAILSFTLFYVWRRHIPGMDSILCDVMSEHLKMLEGLDEEPSTALLFAAQARVFALPKSVVILNLYKLLTCFGSVLWKGITFANLSQWTWWNNVEQVWTGNNSVAIWRHLAGWKQWSGAAAALRGCPSCANDAALGAHGARPHGAASPSRTLGSLILWYFWLMQSCISCPVKSWKFLGVGDGPRCPSHLWRITTSPTVMAWVHGGTVWSFLLLHGGTIGKREDMFGMVCFRIYGQPARYECNVWSTVTCYKLVWFWTWKWVFFLDLFGQ